MSKLKVSATRHLPYGLAYPIMNESFMSWPYRKNNTILKGDMQLHIPGLLADRAVLRQSMGDDHTDESSCEAIQPR